MIPGDIDLTQNLDFRAVSKRAVPRLPAKWKNPKGSYLNLDRSTYITSISNNSITTTTSIRSTNTSVINWRRMDTSSNYTLRRYNYDDWQDYGVNDEELNTYISYNIDSNNITLSYDANDRIVINVNNMHPKIKHDIFGNVIKPKLIENIPDIPWDKKRIDYIPSIPWSDKPKYNRIFLRKYEDAIPWNIYQKSKDKDISLYGRNNKARLLISWLSNKSSLFLDRYFGEDEEDNSRYLTNMNWIRVRNAVID